MADEPADRKPARKIKVMKRAFYPSAPSTFGTTREVALAITAMHEALVAEYGTDFSYIVCGQGRVLAASTINMGTIPAEELNKAKMEIIK
jgi:ABC-type antimicrobial peptide transport system permease subunit